MQVPTVRVSRTGTVCVIVSRLPAGSPAPAVSFCRPSQVKLKTKKHHIRQPYGSLSNVLRKPAGVDYPYPYPVQDLT